MCATRCTADKVAASGKIIHMVRKGVQKGDRSKRRRPRKGFPNRVVGYLDTATHEMVAKAAEKIGESISSFVARAVRERAETILTPRDGK
jgi:predicted HicB family RNase H-like nuclease